MLTEEQKKKITAFAEKCVAGNDELHQMPHIKEVAENALMLVKSEGGDPEICWTAAMLHDTMKSKTGDTGRAGSFVKSKTLDHGTEGSKVAEKFLLDMGLNKDFVERVRDAIYWHNKEFSDGPIERKILWDADKFRTIGVEGFKERLVPFFSPFKKAVDEYYFYSTRFRTKAGQDKVKKHEKEVAEYFAKLKSENAF